MAFWWQNGILKVLSVELNPNSIYDQITYVVAELQGLRSGSHNKNGTKPELNPHQTMPWVAIPLRSFADPRRKRKNRRQADTALQDGFSALYPRYVIA